MNSVNSVVLSGGLAADPEVKWESEDGESAIVRLGVIVRSSKKTDDGYEDVKTIYDVEVFGKYAKLVERKLRKFDAVTVAGKLKRDEWEKDGEKRSKIVVVAQTIDSEGFFRSKDEEGAAAEAPTPAKEEAPAAAPASDDIPF